MCFDCLFAGHQASDCFNSMFQVQALQFEWAWQHPEKSKAVRDDVAALVASCKRAGLSGAKGKVGGQLPQREDTCLES